MRNHISHILTRLNLRDRTQASIVANSFLTWLETKSRSQVKVRRFQQFTSCPAIEKVTFL
ncbi:MAG: hypothetical protein RMZ69_21295 [Nostoc sp. ChiQUE01a]|nr:hypothetical protein [Nostoc sp. ChiQUE01a]